MASLDPEALFQPLVPEAQQHPNFRAMLHRAHAPTRAVLKQWAAGFMDRNHNFVRDFQIQFNGQFWELYLNAAFRHLCFTITYPHPAPDFIIGTPYGDVAVEATTTRHPEGGVPEHQLSSLLSELKDRTEEELVDLATVRLAQSIKKKRDLFDRSYSHLSCCRRNPFVLAIAPFEQPAAFSQNIEAVFRVLFGTRLKPARDGGIIEIEETEVPKNAKTTVPVGLFRDTNYSQISAVLFSNCATMGKLRALSDDTQHCIFKALRFHANSLTPEVIVADKTRYKETLLDGLCVFHNPFARLPLDNRVFFGRDVSQYFFDPPSETFSTDASTGTLIQRFCTVINSGEPSQPDPHHQG